MAIIEPISGTDYPTLPFKVQQSGYSTKNSNDFTFTEYNGAPGRVNQSFLNGWRSARLSILFKDEFEQQWWDFFYRGKFNGKLGGIENGVSPFFAEAEIDGNFGLILCQLTKAEWSKSNYRGLTSMLTLDVQVSPDTFRGDEACKKEVFNSFLNCGVAPSDMKYNIEGMKSLAENGMNPFNIW